MEQNSSSHLERAAVGAAVMVVGVGAPVMVVDVTNVVSVDEVGGNGLAVSESLVVSEIVLSAHGSDKDEVSTTVVP